MIFHQEQYNYFKCWLRSFEVNHLSDCPRNSLMALSQVDLNDKQWSSRVNSFSPGNIVYRENICCFVLNTEPLFLIVARQNSWYEFTLHGCINTSAGNTGRAKITSHSVHLIFSRSQHSSLSSALTCCLNRKISMCVSRYLRELLWAQVIQRGAHERMAWDEAQVGGWGGG